ncbi:MAG: DUF5110 domain-containing protein [Bacteroidales bacterium]|nr:DUF5110 domain-containing protein [Bacteroidales bacterium]MCB9012835.1 DUF5110 domain-containing protein [Bacteroidales bacterium]
MNKILISLVFLICSCSLIRRDNPPEAFKGSFVNRNGIISIEAEHFSDARGWKISPFYTGISISPDKTINANEAFADYQVEFNDKGNYFLYTLSCLKQGGLTDENCFSLSLINDQSQTVRDIQISFPETNALLWSSLSYPERQKAILKIDQPGKYTLRLQNARGNRYNIDKLILAADSLYRPSGTGDVETIATDTLFPRNDIVLPPKWVFGVLYGGYTNQEQSLSVIDSLITGDYPIDAYWIDSYFWDFNQGKGPKGFVDFIGDTLAFPDMELMWKSFQDRSIKGGIWIWNMINEKGNETVFKEFQNKNYLVNIFDNKNSWHNETKDTRTGTIDFTNAQATALWEKKLEPFFSKGLDFLKLDNSSDIPFCSAAFKATQELGKETKGRGFILAHLHSTYDNRHKLYPAKWTGDAKICWSQAGYPDMGAYAMGGLKENIGMVADPKRSTYEIPFLTHDAGGYDYFGSTEQSDELYMRWIQFASMNTIMTIFSTAKNPTRNHPYRYPEIVRKNFRKYTHLRMMLFPYIYSYAISTHLTGAKMVQGDGIHEYQYLFGKEILIAPVYQKGQTTQQVFLPEGDWYDFDTDELFNGNRTIDFPAPLEKLPVFVRKGAIIPMRHYARAIEMGNNDTLLIQVYPSDEKTSFSLLEDDGSSNDYLQGIYSTTKFWVQNQNLSLSFEIDPIQGSFSGNEPERRYELVFHDVSRPSSLKINDVLISPDGKKTSYEYDVSARILKLNFSEIKTEKTMISIKLTKK